MPLLERTWMLEAMKAKGWAPRAARSILAEQTGIEYKRICEYIDGRRRPRPEKAKLIAKALGVSWTLFFDDQAS